MRTEQWTVVVNIDEEDDHTSAEAQLHARDTSSVEGHGLARRNPRDANVPEIGAELATARALSELAHRLLDASIADVEKMTGERSTFRK